MWYNKQTIFFIAPVCLPAIITSYILVYIIHVHCCVLDETYTTAAVAVTTSIVPAFKASLQDSPR